MNILEISNELKQGVRSENVGPSQAAGKPVGEQNTEGTPYDGVQKSENSGGDEKRSSFTKEKLQALIHEAEEQLEKNNTNLKFNVLEDDETIQVEVVDGDGKTIRKIPGDDLLKLSKSLKDLDRGFLDQMS